MPIKPGSTNAIIRENVAELLNAGHLWPQAVAIAYHEARKASAVDAANPPKNPVAFVIYTAGDRILWLHRPDGSWSFPGGSVEMGECAIEGAVRESQEEIGHTPLSGLQRVHDDGFVTIFHCDDGEFPPVLNDEHDGFLWASIDEAPAPIFPVIQTTGAMDERTFDTNGWFERKANPLSKVGVFTYRGRNIDSAPDPNALYRVFRPAEELGAPDCIASFRLLPWTDTHPSAMLGPEEYGLVPAEQKGVQGVIGEEVFFDPTAFEHGGLFGNIKAFSEALLTQIDSGKTELSVGFRCRWDWTPGVFEGQAYDVIQRDIRGNHLALVDDGRMGPEVAVLDHDDINSDPKEKTMADPTNENDEGGGAKEMTLAELTKIVGEFMPMFTKMKEMLEGGAAAGASADADKGNGDDEKSGAMDADKEDEDKKDDKGSAMDAAEIARTVEKSITAKRDLYERVSSHTGAFDHADMSAEQIAAYGLKKLEIEAPKGANQVQFLDAYLLGKGKPVTTAGAMDSASDGNFVDRHLNGGK
jgi:8-oxo-dGTP pyrophosphatase MutT (NUDIX family)